MEMPKQEGGETAPAEKMREVKRLAAEAFGQASAFNMLDPDSEDPKGEILAAKETAVLLQETIKKIVLLAGK